MLKIPGAGDRPPALLAPRPPSPVLESHSHASLPPPRVKRRRTKKSPLSEELAWDQSSGKLSRSRHGERRRMFWMLVGGSCLLLLILGGVLIAMHRGDEASTQIAGTRATTPATGPNTPEAMPPTVPAPTEASFLAAAEPLAKKFLNAGRIEDLLPLVRNRGLAEGRMKRHYPNGIIEAPGMTKFNTEATTHHGAISVIKVRTRKYEEKSLAFVDTPQGLRIDWESWVGWSEMPWEVFLTSKPTTGQVFRLFLCPVDYYNFTFTDDLKWQAYQLTSPDGKQVVYGYAERGSAQNLKILPPPDGQPIPLTLVLKFPENATSNNQVLVAEFVADGWAPEPEPPP